MPAPILEAAAVPPLRFGAVLVRAGITAAFAECSLPAGGGTVVAHFRMAPDQRGRNEPDLDNLNKATVDALDGVLEIRTRTGDRIEADEVRVDRTVVGKRFPRSDERPGARIAVSQSIR